MQWVEADLQSAVVVQKQYDMIYFAPEWGLETLCTSMTVWDQYCGSTGEYSPKLSMSQQSALAVQERQQYPEIHWEECGQQVEALYLALVWSHLEYYVQF